MQLLRRPVAALTLAALGGVALAGILAGPALADAPRPWQMGLQDPASPVAERIEWLHNLVLFIITVICLFVGGLLAYVVWRYSQEKNPNPSQTSHNTTLEVLWTVVPVLILVVIAIPSFRLVFFQDRVPGNADITLNVTGRQWYWDYTYPDQDNLTFSSYMVPTPDLQPGQKRLLDVDNQVVLPVGKNVRIFTTSADVIHSFFIPSLGVQRYAIPGRTIETWVRIDRPGTYYGQCNQICGTNHSFMPIKIHAVPEAEFTAWVADAKKKFAANASPARQAAAQPAPASTVLAQARQ